MTLRRQLHGPFARELAKNAAMAKARQGAKKAMNTWLNLGQEDVESISCRKIRAAGWWGSFFLPSDRVEPIGLVLSFLSLTPPGGQSALRFAVAKLRPGNRSVLSGKDPLSKSEASETDREAKFSPQWIESKRRRVRKKRISSRIKSLTNGNRYEAYSNPSPPAPLPKGIGELTQNRWSARHPAFPGHAGIQSAREIRRVRWGMPRVDSNGSLPGLDPSPTALRPALDATLQSAQISS